MLEQQVKKEDETFYVFIKTFINWVKTKLKWLYVKIFTVPIAAKLTTNTFELYKGIFIVFYVKGTRESLKCT